MADISNPQVVKFSNEKVRPMADLLFSGYYKTLSTINDYNTGDIGTKISDAGAGNFIGDGSDTDGRTRITGGDIFNFITALNALKAFVEGASVATLDRTQVITKPHVNQF